MNMNVIVTPVPLSGPSPTNHADALSVQIGTRRDFPDPFLVSQHGLVEPFLGDLDFDQILEVLFGILRWKTLHANGLEARIEHASTVLSEWSADWDISGEMVEDLNGRLSSFGAD